MAQIQGVLGYHMAPPGQMAKTAKWPKKGQKPVKMTQKQLFLTLLTTFWHPGPEGSDPETHDPRVPSGPSKLTYWLGLRGPSQPEGVSGGSQNMGALARRALDLI